MLPRHTAHTQCQRMWRLGSVTVPHLAAQFPCGLTLGWVGLGWVRPSPSAMVLLGFVDHVGEESGNSGDSGIGHACIF